MQGLELGAGGKRKAARGDRMGSTGRAVGWDQPSTVPPGRAGRAQESVTAGKGSDQGEKSVGWHGVPSFSCMEQEPQTL